MNMKKKLIYILIATILIITILLFARDKLTINPINESDSVQAGASPSNEDEKIIEVKDYIVWGEYGTSYKGSELKYCKIGNGQNVFFLVAAQHGWEDAWAKDGEELTKIANNFIAKLSNYEDETLFDKWTIYVLPQANPDGVIYGTTNDGKGRTTLEGYDMNRSYGSSNFVPYTNARNYTGSKPFLSQETVAIRDLMLRTKTQDTKEIVVIDLHGWLDQTIGTPEVGTFYNEQFKNKNDHSWGKGYLVTWAKEALRSKIFFGRITIPKKLTRHHKQRFFRQIYNCYIKFAEWVRGVKWIE